MMIIFTITSITSVFASNNELLLNNENCEIESYNTSTIEILVKANKAVDELCNYFEGTWVDTGLAIYCKLGGDFFTCTAYKVVKATCGINGAVRLYIEGDTSSALKRLLKSSTDVYLLTKLNRSEYEISEQPTNMTPQSEWY